jgi:RHS repeat-associated protein
VNGTTTVYLHDERDREVAEYDGASGASLRYHLYGPGSAAAPVARVGSDGVSTVYLDFDRLGSVVALVGNASPISQATYLPFSQGSGPGGGAPSAAMHGFAGYRFDDETGLYHPGARYYDPRLGRFLQPDPIRQQGGINLYAYIANDPLDRVDPTGLSGQRANLAQWGLLGAGVGAVCAAAEPCGAVAGTAIIVLGTGAALLDAYQQQSVVSREQQKPDYTYQTYRRLYR